MLVIGRSYWVVPIQDVDVKAEAGTKLAEETTEKSSVTGITAGEEETETTGLEPEAVEPPEQKMQALGQEYEIRIFDKINVLAHPTLPLSLSRALLALSFSFHFCVCDAFSTCACLFFRRVFSRPRVGCTLLRGALDCLGKFGISCEKN